MAPLRQRIKRGWNAFMGRDAPSKKNYGRPSYGRPDPGYSKIYNERSVITAVFNRMAMDAASVIVTHAVVNEDEQYQESVTGSKLDKALKLDANIDQTGRVFIQDTTMALFSEGCIAIVPILKDDGTPCNLRLGRITMWYPQDVEVDVLNEWTGEHEKIVVSKKECAIVYNPMYDIMNTQSSVLQRLMRKFALLDVLDERAASDRLDLIIQLPYTIASPKQRREAEDRLNNIEMQLTTGKHGIAYIDGAEKVVQLNRTLENNLLKQIEYLTKLAYSQIGVTDEILNGTAPDTVMLNYYNRVIEPVLANICDAMTRAFISSNAYTRGQRVMYLNNPFKLVTVEQLAKIADTFTRNEIASSNEIRALLGWKPSSDPRADELRNSNLNHPDEGEPTAVSDEVEEEMTDEEAISALEQELASRKT